MNETETTPGAEFGESQWCVVYDAKTSEVVQIHEHIGGKGQKPLDSDELAKGALTTGVHESVDHLRVAFPQEGQELDDSALISVEDGKIVMKKIDLAELEKRFGN